MAQARYRHSLPLITDFRETSGAPSSRPFRFPHRRRDLRSLKGESAAGGVPGCSGTPGSWKSQPAPGKARGFRGQDTVERHAGLDVVMEKIDQWEQENPASNGRGMIGDFHLWGSRRWSRTKAPPIKPRWRTWVARDSPPNVFLSEGGPLAVVVESFPESPHHPRLCRFWRHRGLRHGRGRRERRG